MSKFSRLLLSALFAVAIFLALMFMFSTTSILEAFQLYPHDDTGGFALFLIEVVLAFIAASIGGLLFLHRLSFGCWFSGERRQRDFNGRESQ